MSETHRIPTMVSTDLVNWTYVGDACPAGGGALPTWIDPSAAFWAPEVVFRSTTDRYYLFVTVDRPVDVVGPAGGPARLDPDGGECSYFWTFDPEVLGDTLTNTGILYYGSYYGGVFATRVDFTPTGRDGPHYEHRRRHAHHDRQPLRGREVVWEGYYYLFGSATNCYAQAGLVVNGDDDNFVKLTDISIWETRQTEFAKEKNPVPAGWSRYGNTVVAPPVTTGRGCGSSWSG